MTDAEDTAIKPPVDEGLKAPIPEQHTRVIGSPLPIGSGGTPLQAVPPGDAPQRFIGPPPPGRGLTGPPLGPPLEVPTGVQKALGAVRAALPWVQRILPLLDGNIGMAVSNMLAPHHHAPQPLHPAPPPVDLAPIEE